MKITVITVCRNALEMLKPTMASVMEQTANDLEYIIIDGASTDGTVDFLETINDNRVKWISEPDNGIYDAMNKGVKLASGRMVIFMNAADRFYEASTLQRMCEDAPDDAGVVYGDVVKIVDGKQIIKKSKTPGNSHRMYFCHQSALTLRELLLKYPFDTKYKYSADFKFFKEIYLGGIKFKQLPYPVSIFDTNGVSNTRRSEGLKDNLKIVCEVDGTLKGMKKIMHLLLPYLICKLRGK